MALAAEIVRGQNRAALIAQVKAAFGSDETTLQFQTLKALVTGSIGPAIPGFSSATATRITQKIKTDVRDILIRGVFLADSFDVAGMASAQGIGASEPPDLSSVGVGIMQESTFTKTVTDPQTVTTSLTQPPKLIIMNSIDSTIGEARKYSNQADDEYYGPDGSVLHGITIVGNDFRVAVTTQFANGTHWNYAVLG